MIKEGIIYEKVRGNHNYDLPERIAPYGLRRLRRRRQEQGSAVQGRSAGGKKLTSQSLSQTDGYLIFVKDANTEEPLAGVKVQFCSDTQCMMGRTDNTGVAVFNMEPGNYEAHILKQPDGYQKNNETAKLTATDKTAVFLLLKEGEELKTADTADTAADETDNKSNADMFND